MGRTRTVAFISVLAVTVAAIVVGGVALTAAVVPSADAGTLMTSAERENRRSAFLDRLWTPIAEEYPEAIRPEVEFGRTLNDRGRLGAEIDCLGGRGVRADIDRGEVVFSSGSGQSTLDLSVTSYVCSARFPRIEEVVADLDRSQLLALYDYYTDVTRPCLAVSGNRTWNPPSRADFTADDGDHAWNPYFPLRGAQLSQDELETIEARCPAVPKWLDFRTP